MVSVNQIHVRGSSCPDLGRKRGGLGSIDSNVWMVTPKCSPQHTRVHRYGTQYANVESSAAFSTSHLQLSATSKNTCGVRCIRPSQHFCSAFGALRQWPVVLPVASNPPMTLHVTEEASVHEVISCNVHPRRGEDSLFPSVVRCLCDGRSSPVEIRSMERMIAMAPSLVQDTSRIQFCWKFDGEASIARRAGGLEHSLMPLLLHNAKLSHGHHPQIVKPWVAGLRIGRMYSHARVSAP